MRVPAGIPAVDDMAFDVAGQAVCIALDWLATDRAAVGTHNIARGRGRRYDPEVMVRAVDSLPLLRRGEGWGEGGELRLAATRID